MRFSYLSHLECPRDGRSFDAGVRRSSVGAAHRCLPATTFAALARAV
jgi:hypothetical protein